MSRMVKLTFVAALAVVVGGLLVLLQTTRPDSPKQPGIPGGPPASQDDRARVAPRRAHPSNGQVATRNVTDNEPPPTGVIEPEPCTAPWFAVRLNTLRELDAIGDSSSAALLTAEIIDCSDLAVQPLQEELVAGTPIVNPCLTMLARIRTDKAIRVLLGMLVNTSLPDESHELNACTLLVSALNIQHLPFLGEALIGCPSRRARRCIAKLFQSLPDQKAITLLIDALPSEPDGEVQSAILSALEYLSAFHGLAIPGERLVELVDKLVFTLSDGAANRLFLLVGQQLPWDQVIDFTIPAFLAVMEKRSTESQIFVPANIMTGLTEVLKKGGAAAEEELLRVYQESDNEWLKWSLLDHMGFVTDGSAAGPAMESIVLDVDAPSRLRQAAFYSLGAMPASESFYTVVDTILRPGGGFQDGSINRKNALILLAQRIVKGDADARRASDRLLEIYRERVDLKQYVLDALDGRIETSSKTTALERLEAVLRRMRAEEGEAAFGATIEELLKDITQKKGG